MEDKSLELMSDDGLKLLQEFRNCQSREDFDELKKRWDKLNRSIGNNTIPHYDMTLEEFRAKYHTTSYEEMKKRMGM